MIVPALLIGFAVWLWISSRGGLWRLDFRRWHPPAWFEGRADGMAMVRRVWMASALGIGIGLFLGWPWGLLVAPIGSLSLTVALGHVVPRGVKLEQQLLLRELPQVCLLVASCLESGLPLRLAVAEVGAAFPGPTQRLLVVVSNRISLGESERSAWEGFAGHRIFGDLARDVGLAVEAGTALTETFQRHASLARVTSRNAAEERAKRAGVNSILPLMACYLPAFLLLGVVPIVGGMFG